MWPTQRVLSYGQEHFLKKSEIADFISKTQIENKLNLYLQPESEPILNVYKF